MVKIIFYRKQLSTAIGFSCSSNNRKDDSAEILTAIVEMFVLKPKKVPNESSEDFERRKNRRQQVPVDVQRLRERQRDGPAKP